MIRVGQKDIRSLSIGRRVNRLIGQAISRYDLISGGDRIAVGVSGGKDSLSLLWMLEERRSRAPVHYELHAVHVDLGFDGETAAKVGEFCQALGIPCHTIETGIGHEAHGPENRESPCYLCAKLRRKRLFEVAGELGCNKLALGHNRDDIIETFFLNVFYSSELSTMLPAQVLFNGRLTIIRPLALVDEPQLVRLARELDLPVVANPCPSLCRSKRREMEEVLGPLLRNRRIKNNVFRALSNVKTDYLLPKPKPFPRS